MCSSHWYRLIWTPYFDIVQSVRFVCPGDVHIVFHAIGMFKCQESDKAVIAFSECHIKSQVYFKYDSKSSPS